MPKPLSLKKVSAPVKNQKSITQFFKNSNGLESNKLVADNLQSSSSNSEQSKPLKRRLTSPTHEEKYEERSKIVSPYENSNEKHRKRHKNDIAKTTPCKESKVLSLKENVTNSPRKVTQTNSKKIMKTESVTNNHDENNVESRQSRKPLSPIKNEKGFEELSEKSQFQTKTPEKYKISNTAPKNQMVTPTKSPISEVKEVRRSPRIAKLKTPDKGQTSPTKKKNGVSAKVALDFDNVDDMFADQWDSDLASDFEEQCKEDLDLNVMQRCEVISVELQSSCLLVRLKNSEDKQATCSIEGIWCDTPLAPRDVISVIASRDATSGRYRVTNTEGLLVLRADHLMSTTSVVAGVFCRRKAILQERFKGIDCGNSAMTIGILIHELVQKALTQRISDVTQLRHMANDVIASSTPRLYDAGVTVEETRRNMEVYLTPLSEFMKTYVLDKTRANAQKNKWNGHIDDILDIEENICCPQLGLKGKIDATLQVTIHERKVPPKSCIVPLELKSGRASGSVEHRGQLILYNMMLSVQRESHPTEADQLGALLYLKERVDLREVRCGHPEKRDLIMLRNQLVQYLASSPQNEDPEKLTNIEEASQILCQKLPEPVHHENACAKCPYLTLCSVHLWHTQGPTVDQSHPLSKLRDLAIGHLTEEHIRYFLHWSALLKMEERVQMTTSPLHALWTEDSEKRSKRGACASNLKLKSVQSKDDRFIHVFLRSVDQEADTDKNDSKMSKGPQEGEFSIVSIRNRPWIAAGVISAIRGREIHIMLERDLSRRLGKDTIFYIDTYESYATTVQNLTNLGALMEDTEQAGRLRKLIIDRSTPIFSSKLPRDVGRLGAKLMKSLNVEQQRAVLKAVAAQDYVLLQGLPGTGKTQTISVLIQMLVALKQRVLVTAHTHSAVDTVLNRLPPSLRILRLGSSVRVAPSLLARCEQNLTADCDTPEKLTKLYDSMEVVGVTCLGAAHALLSRATFDVCIVDEATQVPQCTVLRPLLSATKFVLVGDPEQLPPVVRSRAARRLGMEQSLFHRLKDTGGTLTLQLQYRMNSTLAGLANSVAYGGRLKCATERVRDAVVAVHQQKLTQLYGADSWLLTACSPDLKAASLFLDMGVREKTNRSCANSGEACVVLAIVTAFVEGGVTASDIGVIAPYREQVALLRRSLTKLHPNVDVSTVDQFQGRDKSVVLYSCTRSEVTTDDVKEGEVLNDQRRLAVSVTRAKHKLIIIGHATALTKYKPIQNAINACSTLVLTSKVLQDAVKKFGSLVL